MKKYQTRQANYHKAHREERATTLTTPAEQPELQELSMSDTPEVHEDVAAGIHGNTLNTSRLEGTTNSQGPPRIQTLLQTRPQRSTKMPARFQDFLL